MLRYGLIGSSLKHSYSRDIHTLFGYEYDLIETSEEGLKDVINNPEYGGFNVTVPYKEVIMPLLDEVDSSALSIGACNTIVKRDGQLIGFNTDFYGLKTLIQENKIEIQDKNIFILGSGGTAKTAMAVTLGLGGKARIVSRSGELNYDNFYLAQDTEVIINTTPHGMFPSLAREAIIDVSRFPKLSAVIDVVFNPLKTALLMNAGALGIKAVGGLEMLVNQAIAAAEIFTGKKVEYSPKKIMNILNNKYSNIVLVGMPGSGKSTIGKALAELLNMRFFDTDEIIQERNGFPCGELIDMLGIEKFRAIEKLITLEVATERGAVIATGGGAVLDADNRFALSSNGRVAYIYRPIERLSREGRPLSKDIMSVKKLFEDREKIYINMSDIIIDNEGNLSDIVNKLKGALEYED